MGKQSQGKIYVKKNSSPTQRSIAEKHNVSESYVSQMLSGDKPIPESFLEDICKLVNKKNLIKK